jgi:creatinine amidohydrolase/Fe(II)-dependent formamide hydrolase-like protein
MVLNGHGGNMRQNLEPKAPEQMKKLNDLGITYITYWKTCPASFYEQHLELETSAGHAGEFETSFAMVAFPQRIASISKGGQILAAVIDGVSEQVQKMLAE